MRRAALAIVSTIAGLVMLLSFKSHTTSALGSGTSAIAPATTSPGTSSTPPASASGSTSSSNSSTATSATGTRTVSGDAYDTRYGTVQVQITVTNGRLTDVTPLQLPDTRQRDIQIDNYAVPQLIQESLNAQSANIDIVSGATYTSEGYIRSLQSALDKAKV